MTSPSPIPKSKPKVKQKKGKRILDSGLSLKSYGPPPHQVDSKRENKDESNMFKENIIKEMFSESLG